MIITFKFLYILISAFIKIGQKQVGDKEVKWQYVFARSRSKTTFLAPNTPRGGGGGTAIYELYRYVSLWRVWFSSSLL